MKIIHLVLGRANPNRMNGVNRVVHNLASAQAKVGFDVSVWGITNSFDKVDDVFRSYKTSWFQPKGRFRINSSLKNEINKSPKETVFHLHGGFLTVYYRLTELIKKAGKEFVFTPHGTYTNGAMEGNKWVKTNYFSLFEKRMLSRAKAIQCLGHCEEDDLKKLYPKANTFLVPNGQNFEELKVSGEVNCSNDFVIGYCGRISKMHKGMDVLLDSFEYYKKTLGGKGKLNLIGDGEYLGEMMELSIDKQIASDVVFLGKQFGEKKVRELIDMNVFVHTSRNEGLPTAVIEASSLSIPCIVTKMTSMDTYVNKYEAGWVIDSLNPQQIAKLFLESEKEYEDNKLQIKGRNALKMARENFDWDKIATSLGYVYAT